MCKKLSLKKNMGVLFAICFVMSVFSTQSLCVKAADEETLSVNLVIEGISDQLYSDTVSVDKDATVQDVLETADEASDEIELTFTESSYGDFLSAVNEDVAGQFGGYDGWMFLVNGESPSAGMSAVTVSDTDEIVVYYADPYGDDGFQYPELDDSKIADGTVTFTSDDATYDADGNATYTTNPVADATVTVLDADGEEAGTYTTDETGAITLDLEAMKTGDYTIQIAKESSDGKPLVLRSSFSESITANETDSNVWVYVVIAVVVIAGIGAIVVVNRKKKA